MPWKVSGVLEQRSEFIYELRSERWTMGELCARFGISRETGYKWLRRYEADGIKGLDERSRAPVRHPNQTPEEIEQRVLAVRYEYPRWGARKLRAWLEREEPGEQWPAASTIGELLKRAGLAIPRRKRRKIPPYTRPFQAADGANAVWCADYKGWFRTGDGQRIDPLTISDAYSRYLLRCQIVERTDTEGAQAIFEATFREYGLPRAIRTDNGSPFGSRGLAGLSRLAVYWMKLGIAPERIEPGHPEQNGRHERMHRTLKDETASPPQANRRAQQRAFRRFQQQYNHERPHEALGQQTPASRYVPSPRPYPARLSEPQYETGMQVRRVQAHGQMYWKHQAVFVSETLAGERVGLEPIDDRDYLLYFGRFVLGRFDSRKLHVKAIDKSREEGK